jgi:TonB family protein
MNKLLLLLILCALLVPQMATASDNVLEDALNHQFKGKTLILRHPQGDDSLRYDAQGRLLNQGTERDWTVYGIVQIQKVELGGNKLRLQGLRLYVRRDGNGLAPFEFKHRALQSPPVKPSVKIEVSTDEPLSSADQAQTLLGSVFALNKADLLAAVPEFWRGYLAAHLNDFDFKQGKEIDFTTVGPVTPNNVPAQNGNASQPPAGPGNHNPASGIYHVGADVQAPKAKNTPEPSYTEAARYEKFQGVVVVSIIVDSAGNVSKVGLVRPLGLGLDQNAVATIKTWNFEPARLKGNPVAVEMNVEVAFHLY